MKFGVVCFARSGQSIFITDKKIEKWKSRFNLGFLLWKNL